jgi:hypothetical protein
MTDRELLEWAAKAAGLEWRWYAAPIGQLLQVNTRTGWVFWNPLTKDGDALRLAVKLQLRVLPPEDEFGLDRASVRIAGKRDLIDAHDPDPYAATRRAIVRAAAAIGRSMETQSEKNARFRKALDEMPIAEPPHPPETLGNTPRPTHLCQHDR